MKLRLPHKLQAALIAAITVVGTTLPQSFAAEPTAYAITLGNATTKTISSGDGKMWLEGGTSRNFDHGWMMEFTINSTTLSADQGQVIFRAQGDQGGLEIYLTGNGTISMTDGGGSKPMTSALTFNYGDQLRAAFEEGDQTLYFTNVTTGDSVSGTWPVGQNWANIGTWAATFYTNSKVTLTVGDGYDMNGIRGDEFKAYATYVPPAPVTGTEYVWVGGTNGVWDTTTPNWKTKAAETAVPFESGDTNTVTFDATATCTDITLSTADAVVQRMTVEGTAYTLDLNGNTLTANALTVTSGLSITGTGTLAVGGGVTLGEGAGITVGENSTLQLNNATAAKALMRGSEVTNNGNLEITSDITLGANESSVMGGTLVVSNNAVLSLGTGDSQTVGISSFGQVVLNGGTVKVQSQANTINNLTVTEGKTGELLIIDLNNPSGDSVPTYQMAGVTSVGAGGTLIVANFWNAQANIAALVGEGTLKVTGNNNNSSVSPQTGSNEQMVFSIGSLSTENASFTGDLIIDHIPSADSKKDSYTINTGSREVTFKSFSVNYSMNRAAQALAFNLGADTTVTGLMTLTSGAVNVTGDHLLTVGGITGSGNLSVAGDLTLNGAGTYEHTGALSIGGQLVKTGSGTQTLGGFDINKTILVQGGTLTLNGTYSLDGLADDEGRTYTFEDETGTEADKAVGGFRITNGTKTVYTENGGEVTLAAGTKFQLDGVDVEVNADGVYTFPASADKTTLWVNGSTPLSYDAYFTASAGALTTAQVAAGATLEIGTNAVGTLAFQTNNSTINLSGTGTVNAISGTGTLNLGGTVTLASALTVADGQTFGTSGAGTLNVGTLNANGGTTTFDSAASINRLIVNGSAAATVGGSGAVAVNSTSQDQGVEIEPGKSLTLLSTNMNVAGTIHNNGSLTVGDGTTPALVKTVYFVNGNANNQGSSSFDIKAHATLVATGADTDNSHASGWVMGEWNNSTTGTVAGSLLVQNASIWGCDSTYTLNIESGGLVATKGVRAKKNNVAYTVNLKEGGTLVLGGTSTPGPTVLNATAGSTIGTYATSGVDYSGGIATTAVQDKAVTFDTSLYTFDNNGTVIVKGATAGALTISGAITGTAAVAKAGAGTLVLSGTNTYSGGTVVNGGTLQAASAGALGSGNVTVNAGTLELTTTTAVAGALTINDGGTLKLAGENMLTADTLALGSGTVTFDLSNISVASARTITLATAETSTSLGSATVNIVWNGLNPIFHYDEGVQVSGNSWIITLTADSQKLTWAGEVGDWSHSPEDTHWLNISEQPSAFAANDTAIFGAGEPAVANIKEAITAAGLEIQAGANVTLRKAESAETATLNTLEMDIAGSLATSVDVTASAVEAAGADAAWNITAGTVTADSITVAQDGTLALSGTGMAVKTVSGPGTVEVGSGFTLTLGQQIDSEQATNLSIRNNGTVVVELGSSQNVINMDTASTGTLEVTAGTISSQSTLGADQTLKLAGGTVFAVKGSETAFASDITLAGNVAMQLKDGANATIAGAVSGEGKTLSVSGGGANQTVTFTDTVTLGGLNIAGSGEKLVFQGTGSSLGAIYAQSGAFTIQFSKAAGEDSASYTFGTFAMAPTSSTGTRWLIVDEGVTVHGTGNSLEPTCTLSSAWGVGGGGLEVNGVLTTDAAIGLEANNQTAYIKGTGTINTAGLNFCNGSHTYIQGGITINITSNRGIFARSSTAAAGDVHLKDATLQAIDADWEFQVGRAADSVTLEDTTTGTAFEAARDHTITITKAMGGTGKLVKKGEGTVVANAANTYSGGTVINAGKLATTNATALGTGDVNIASTGTLEMRSSLTIAGNLTGTGNITYTGNEAGTLSLTKNQTHQTLAMDIGSAAGAGALNLTLNSNSDYKFSGDVDVNDINHHTNSTVFVLDEGDVTITGTVLTGRLVVGEQSTETAAVFTLSGENAMLVYTADANHTYTAAVEGYGTFQLVGGATQTLTGTITGFHGTFAADGTGSVLTLQSTLADDVTLNAVNGGQIILKSAAKEAEVNSGTFELLANVETLNVSGENNTLDIGTGSVENISLGGDLKVAGELDNFYIHSGTTGTVVTADAGKTLVVDGTAHVDARVEFHSSDTQKVEIAATRVEEQEQYALESDHFDVTADTVEKVAAGDVAIANKVSAATVVNNVAEDSGKLSLTTGVDLEALKNVIAASGDIEFLNVDPETQATLDNLTIADHNTVSFSTDGSIGDVATEATVTVAGTLTAGEGATLNANLVMDGTTGSPAVLDVSAMGGNGGLHMGSSVTLKPGELSLSENDIAAVTNLQFKQMYDLFNEVDDFIVGENPYGNTDAWVDAKDVFANLAVLENDYYLFYSGADTAGGKGGNVGTIYIMRIPEPTTGTLSLLALCALAARRRRKH